MSAIIALDSFRVNFVPSILAISFDLAPTSPTEYRPTWTAPEPTLAEDAEWLGFTLGADGVLAELCTPDAVERAAFDRGHDAGDDHLWRVDPLWAAHMKQMAELAEVDAPLRPVRPEGGRP